jgi:hypothetical protein
MTAWCVAGKVCPHIFDAFRKSDNFWPDDFPPVSRVFLTGFSHLFFLRAAELNRDIAAIPTISVLH